MVIRLLLTFDGETAQLSRRLVEMRARVPRGPDRAGLYIDLRTADAHVLVRVPARVPTTQEVFPEPPARRIVRVDAPRLRTFLVTAPVVAGIDHIALVRLQATGRTRDLARFPWAAP